ncbi:MAG: dihydrodipicolinate synthase family protein, partial [Deltaproteobacteria bacterium]|nr:dihydrodipicolinate synthase family protein [Nannocystaceae bacterium]
RMAKAHGFFSTLAATETGMTFEEQKRFVTIVAEEAGEDILVSTTLLMDSFEQQAAMLAHAQTAGVDAVLLGLPANFYPRTSKEVLDALAALIESTELAVVLYPSPHFNLQRLHPSGYPLDILEALAAFDNVVGIKCGEMALFEECHRRVGATVQVQTPVERSLPNAVLRYGQQWMGAGCYEVLQSPEKPYVVDMFRLLRERKVDAAMEIYWRLTPARVTFEEQFNKTVMLGTYNWTLQKYYQWCVGGNGGFTRQPAMKPHQHEMEATKMGFRMIGITPRQPDAEFYTGRTFFTGEGTGTAAGGGPPAGAMGDGPPPWLAKP